MTNVDHYMMSSEVAPSLDSPPQLTGALLTSGSSIQWECTLPSEFSCLAQYWLGFFLLQKSIKKCKTHDFSFFKVLTLVHYPFFLPLQCLQVVGFHLFFLYFIAVLCGRDGLIGTTLPFLEVDIWYQISSFREQLTGVPRTEGDEAEDWESGRMLW